MGKQRHLRNYRKATRLLLLQKAAEIEERILKDMVSFDFKTRVRIAWKIITRKVKFKGEKDGDNQ